MNNLQFDMLKRMVNLEKKLQRAMRIDLAANQKSFSKPELTIKRNKTNGHILESLGRGENPLGEFEKNYQATGNSRGLAMKKHKHQTMMHNEEIKEMLIDN